jgi:hypothetical protein
VNSKLHGDYRPKPKQKPGQLTSLLLLLSRFGIGQVMLQTICFALATLAGPLLVTPAE